MMIAAASVASLAIGLVISYRADAYPRYRNGMETLAGGLLIVGFGLLGHLVERLTTFHTVSDITDAASAICLSISR